MLYSGNIYIERIKISKVLANFCTLCMLLSDLALKGRVSVYPPVEPNLIQLSRQMGAILLQTKVLLHQTQIIPY